MHILLFADREVEKKTLAGSEFLEKGFESNYMETIGVGFLSKKVELPEMLKIWEKVENLLNP